MENVIKITGCGRMPIPLPMGGKDDKGNFYGVDNISLMKNNRRFLPVTGEFHFSRYEPEDWREELLKIRAGGVDIVATYVFWIHHEEKEGEWDFSGCRNLRKFLEICGEISMPVWLRIGPWAHGECRNGGFPDWVAFGKFKTRSNDSDYLKLVERWYRKLGEETKGMMCRDGGPVIGLQLENECGHCGGPRNREEGMLHMRTLKRMAMEAGFEVPYYTATGWGGGYVVDYEMLPVLGGYVDAPWAWHVKEMPASANFVFSPYKQDENIGSDLKRGKSREFTFDIHINPYLTAELGGGLQVTSHRRTYPWPEDIEAQALCALGSGANLLGYYMYHGGINPDGKYSTLQESLATGYYNDLPVKSYDFQTCIRQSGEVNKSFGALKKLHLLLQDFGEILAGADTYFPEKAPESPEDCHTLRVTARVNQRAGVGFLFLNNHQRKRTMENHENFRVGLFFGEMEIVLEHLTVKDGECGIIPFLLPDMGNRNTEEDALANILPERTNAFLLCRLKQRCFFWSDLEQPFFEWKHDGGDAVVFTRKQANRVFRIGGKLYLTEREDSCLIHQEEIVSLITKADRERILVYGDKGEPQKLTAETERVEIAARIALGKEVVSEDSMVNYREYIIDIDKIPSDKIHQLYMEADYIGDRAEVYIDGTLVDDWYTTGEKWHIALKRFGYPRKLLLRIYSSGNPLSNPYGDHVYYDLSVEDGCKLYSVKLLPEYEIAIMK